MHSAWQHSGLIVLATQLPLLVVWLLDMKARERKMLQTGIGKAPHKKES